MKAIKMMMFVAAATMLFAACGKDDDKSTPTAADNQLVYNGKVYQAEVAEGNVNSNNAQLGFSGEKDGIYFMVDCHIQDVANRTYDLTQEDADHVLHFHIVVEGPAVQSQEDIFDLQYQNGPHFWYFLNGDNVSNASAFTSGTAETTLTDTSLILNVSGTLVNGKSLAFRVVLPREE